MNNPRCPLPRVCDILAPVTDALRAFLFVLDKMPSIRIHALASVTRSLGHLVGGTLYWSNYVR